MIVLFISSIQNISFGQTELQNLLVYLGVFIVFILDSCYFLGNIYFRSKGQEKLCSSAPRGSVSFPKFPVWHATTSCSIMSCIIMWSNTHWLWQPDVTCPSRRHCLGENAHYFDTHDILQKLNYKKTAVIASNSLPLLIQSDVGWLFLQIL